MRMLGGLAPGSSLLLCFLGLVQAGPVLRSSRMVREIYPEVDQEIPDSSQVQGSSCVVGDTTYPSGSPLPSTSPCLKCSCVWGVVRCEAEACTAVRGCRAVARPGRCCPAYECECEHQGRRYANGQRLPQPPGHECSVCYCRGGHVQCAEVGCYTRTDCPGRTVKGECCPKYDHCPPRGSPLPSTSLCLKCSCVWGVVRCEAEACTAVRGCRAVARPGEHQGRRYANGQRLPQPPGHECSVCYCRGGHVQCAEVGCYTRTDCPGRTVKGECCPKYDHCPPRDPLSDRLSSPTLQLLDQDLISTWQTNTTSPSYEGSGDDDLMSDEPKKASTPVTFSIKEIEGKGTKKNEENIPVVKTDKSTQTDSARPQITIQEVTPPRQEYIPPPIPSTPSSSTVPPPSSTPLVQVVPANPSTSTGRPQLLTDSSNELDVESYASERAEVYDHPPPVLRIGDQLLFIKQGQLVPEKDASTPSPVITLIGAEGLQIGLGSGEVIEQDIVPRSSSTEQPRIETTKSSEEEITKKVEETTETNENIDTSSEFITVNTTGVTEKYKSSTTVSEHTEYIPEENPYYPSIPEDIMISGQDEITTDVISESNNTKLKQKTEPNLSKQQSEDITVIPLRKIENKTTDSKILPEILELRNNSTKKSNVTHQQWLKNEPTKISIPLINEKAAIPDEILSMTAASDITTEDYEISTNAISTISYVDLTTQKLDKIMAGPLQPFDPKSKETLELNEELFESGEFTTIAPLHSSLISSEDASVEITPNDSKLDMSELVETVPGFEHITQKTVPINEQHLTSPDSPKGQVELIEVIGEKTQTSHVEMKDEKQKRDVVKKVLKDTFDNPKENIRTDLLENTTMTAELLGQNEELNVVKPNLEVNNRNVSKLVNNKHETETQTTKAILHKTKLADK